MKNCDILNGSLVPVRPDFQDDPARQRGKVGVVIYAREADDTYIRLLVGREANYSTQDRMALKHKINVFQELNGSGTAIKPNDFKAFYDIIPPQDNGTLTALVNALQWAAQTLDFWDKALIAVAPATQPAMTKTQRR